MSDNPRRDYCSSESSPEALSSLLGNRSNVYTYFILVMILDQNNAKRTFLS